MMDWLGLNRIVSGGLGWFVLAWAGLGWAGAIWVGLDIFDWRVLDSFGLEALDCIGLGGIGWTEWSAEPSVGLAWIVLGWFVLGRVGLAGSDWVAVGWTVLDEFDGVVLSWTSIQLGLYWVARLMYSIREAKGETDRHYST